MSNIENPAIVSPSPAPWSNTESPIFVSSSSFPPQSNLSTTQSLPLPIPTPAPISSALFNSTALIVESSSWIPPFSTKPSDSRNISRSASTEQTWSSQIKSDCFAISIYGTQCYPTAGTTTHQHTGMQPSSTAVTGASENHTHGVSKGAASGVGIACLFAGAVCAAVVVLSILRRRPAYRHVDYNNSEQSSHGSGGQRPDQIPLATLIPLKRAGNVQNLGASDSDSVITRISELRNKIKDYVDNHFHDIPGLMADSSRLELGSLAAAAGTSESALTKMLRDPETRRQTIPLFMSWSVLWRGMSSLVLSKVILNNNGSNSESLYNEWKNLTEAFLNQRQDTSCHEEIVTKGRNDTFARMYLFLQLFQDFRMGHIHGDPLAHHKLTVDILEHATDLLVLLFSQPGVVSFDFTGEGGRLVAFPGIEQTFYGPITVRRRLWDKEFADEF